MKVLKKVLKYLSITALLFLLYVVICIGHGTMTDYQPEEKIVLELSPNATPSEIITAGRLRFLNWNVGYGGLGAKSNFFYDNGNPFFFSSGKMVQSPREYVDENIAGIAAFIKENPSDFVLLQEVDKNSKRSYYINQHELYGQQLPNYTASFALNYCVQRVVIPVCEPWNVLGKAESGLSTYSKYKVQNATRYQFPGSCGWPDYIFQLDRCMAVHRYKTAHPEGKELLVINTHNSAYDDGSMKRQEMAYLKTFILAEYAKGNYIVVGGDWNQTPPGVAFDVASKAVGIPTDSSYHAISIATDFMPEGWQWAFDPTVPTNRNLVDILDYGKTAVALIDYYLVSPNVNIIKVEGKNLKFAHSDHQPVLLEVELQGLVDSVSMVK